MNLTCQVTGDQRTVAEAKTADYVFWYHNGKVVNYDQRKSGIRVDTESAISRITINNAQNSDSGNYTCMPSNSEPDYITVHVLNGEAPAAMQDSEHSSSAGSLLSLGQLWRVLYGITLPCMFSALVCLR